MLSRRRSLLLFQERKGKGRQKTTKKEKVDGESDYKNKKTYTPKKTHTQKREKHRNKLLNFLVRLLVDKKLKKESLRTVDLDSILFCGASETAVKNNKIKLITPSRKSLIVVKMDFLAPTVPSLPIYVIFICFLSSFGLLVFCVLLDSLSYCVVVAFWARKNETRQFLFADLGDAANTRHKKQKDSCTAGTGTCEKRNEKTHRFDGILWKDSMQVQYLCQTGIIQTYCTYLLYTIYGVFPSKFMGMPQK